ncbi:serum opacification factor [Streptococcus pyogenes]|uniref:serum opacification factor n=1 Tax=Streptococcus pyogenes TaxID=1314 RepID=UPI0010A1085E|nr:serum opacification factor [Streptococcus pyogenes]VGQ68798.1 Fibronectin-binding protein [Streptococcus pyogenes]VHB92599.1 serum opacity factor [Streptococcus pyogenes]VHC30014.1 serum opacity factor [Streptococcus pyogenes]
MTNCKYKLRKLSVGLVSVGTMLIAPTVLGQEVSTGASSTETSASTNTSTASAGTSTSETAASGTGSEAAVVSSEGSQSSESGQASTQPQAQTLEQSAATSPSSNSSSSDVSSDAKSTKSATSSTSSASSTSSSEDKAPKAASTKSSSATVASSSNGSNQGAGAEDAPQMMDVERYEVDNKETELKVKDGKETNGSGVSKKLIRNRDDEQRGIVDVKREVKTNSDGTIDVTVTVKPKQIDEGADVMALLDVSKKMTEEDFKNAKDKIKKLVKTLTSMSKSTDSQPNHNARNSVRLMTFYREISKPIDISGKTEEQLEKLLNELREEAKANYDWGVDLQGAIHKAREIFRKEKESKKRQHIVLFSQGESTFSYDIKDKKSLRKSSLPEVTTSNPLLHWPPIFNHTNRKADMITDFDKLLIPLAEKFGIKISDSLKTALTTANLGSSALSALTGESLAEYLKIKEYCSDSLLKEDQFDYSNRIGEGYYHHSFSEKKIIGKMPFKGIIDSQLEDLFKSNEESKKSWFGQILNKFSLVESWDKAKKQLLLKVLEALFHSREYVYYNHNLSAIAEAKMAQQEGITFYSVDVTSPNQPATKRFKRATDKTEAEKRDEKFDDYLKKMSEGGNDFFKDVDKAEKFKDTLTNVTVTETFEDGVNVKENSCQTSLDSNSNSSNSNCGGTVDHKKPSQASLLSWFSTKESLTWTISKEQLKEAFEKNGFLTFKYKLQVNKDKLLKDNKRIKRGTSTENKTSVTKDIISNTITYKINEQKVEGNKLENVKLTYTKETVPVPDVEGTVEVPQAPEKPLVDPILPPQPSLPNIPTPQLPKDEDLEISGGHGPIVDIVEDTGTGVEGGAQNGVVSTQENKDPIVDITEDTQPGMSGSNDATVVEEDTAPKRPDVLVGGQSDPIDITEDTQPSVSGSNDATVVEEDTVPQRPDILVGGQSDPIDITEDTQPGMSGANDATVIEEDTKPKRFFHFDNEPQAPEKPKEQPSLSLPQAPVYKAAHHLPASGDKREASFTIAALTIIGAAGLLSKKRRDTEEN